MEGLTQGLHPIAYYPYLTCILSNIIVSNNSVVEAVAHLLLDGGLAGAPVCAVGLSLTVCGLSCTIAMRCKVWAEIFKVFRGVYLLFLTGFMRINSSSAFKISSLLSLLRDASKVLRSSFCFIWGHCFGCEMLSLATWIFV